MVSATKCVAYLWQTVIGQFLGQAHRQLARPCDRPTPAFGKQVGYPDLEITRNRLLDIVYRDQLFLQG
jgi:hypothetical protein